MTVTADKRDLSRLKKYTNFWQSNSALDGDADESNRRNAYAVRSGPPPLPSLGCCTFPFFADLFSLPPRSPSFAARTSPTPTTTARPSCASAVLPALSPRRVCWADLDPPPSVAPLPPHSYEFGWSASLPLPSLRSARFELRC